MADAPSPRAVARAGRAAGLAAAALVAACDFHPALGGDGGGPAPGDGGGLDAAEGPPGCAASWRFAAPVTITSAEALADYAVEVRVDTAAMIAAGALRPGCEDLRFTDGAGALLPHALLGGCGTAAAELWVRVPALAAGATVVYLRHGNPAVASASDPRATFPLIDDVPSSALAGWRAGAERYEAGVDLGQEAGVDGGAARSAPYALRLHGAASCMRAPYDGLAVYLEAAPGLPEGRYCVDVSVRTDIEGFRFTTRGTAGARVEAAGARRSVASASCPGYQCTTSTGWQRATATITGAVPTLRLVGESGDCTTATTWFDDVRVRRCAEVEPVAVVGPAVDCPR